LSNEHAFYLTLYEFINNVLLLQFYRNLFHTCVLFSVSHFTDPKFAEPIVNVTIPVGREAILICVVDDLSGFKVKSCDIYIRILLYLLENDE